MTGSGPFGKSALTAGRWCHVWSGRSFSYCSSFCLCLFWTLTAAVDEGCSELGGFALIVIALSVAVAQANRSDVPGAMPEPFAQAMADASLLQVGADWPAYGGTYNAQRYSPLDQINRENVRRFERAWTFRTGEPKERWGAETTPLKIGDTLYLCTGRSKLIAIDAATGAERWRHDPKVADASIPYTAACRGVAYYAAPNTDPASPCATRIIRGRSTRG